MLIVVCFVVNFHKDFYVVTISVANLLNIQTYYFQATNNNSNMSALSISVNSMNADDYRSPYISPAAGAAGKTVSVCLISIYFVFYLHDDV